MDMQFVLITVYFCYIVVLSDGVVKESGRPDELMKKNGIFAVMVKAQAEGKEWALN